MISVSTYKKEGFKLTWPFYPDVNTRTSIILTVKEVAGLSFSKPEGGWVSEGPEVILDMDRIALWNYVSCIMPDAQRRIDAFRQDLEKMLEVKHQEAQGQYGYQKIGSETLALQSRSLLADSMGLGKSKQVLDAVATMKPRNVLVIAPKTLTYNWLAEVEKWYPNWDCSVVPDAKKLRGEFWSRLAKVDLQIIIANYEKLLLADWPSIDWDVIVFDEANKIKNTKTKTHKLAKKLKGQYIWALSGTPMEIRLDDLYGIMSILRPSVFGTWTRFKDHHLVMDGWGNIIGQTKTELLKERIAPWMLRRKKEDVLKQLPPKLYNNVFIELGHEEKREYDKIKKDFVTWLTENEKSLNQATAIVQLLRLQQFVDSPDLLADEGDAEVRGSKLAALEEIIQEHDGRLMVFTRFEQMANRLVSWLGLNPQALISGPIPAAARVSRVAAFNAGTLGKVLVSTDAGAYGLNVTGADVVVHYDQLWNPGKMWQREDRLHRIGQTQTVNVLNLLVQDSIDEGMARVLDKRRELFKDIVDGAEDTAIMKLGTSALRKIIEGRL